MALMRSFDTKFGAAFLESVPLTPGVYQFAAADGTVIYVGKAKNLRRRLSQYRLATRRKAHRRMRLIVRDAVSLRFESHESAHAAELAELRLIQSLKPRWNLAGAFSRLYPYFGLRAFGEELHLCLTSQRDDLSGYEFFGAFRSRQAAVEAFSALSALFAIAGQRVALRQKVGRRVLRCEAAQRGLPLGSREAWSRFFRGESPTALSELAVALVERRRARETAEAVQEDLKTVRAFWREEILPLRKAIDATGFGEYPVPQGERDALFIDARHR